MGNTPCKTAAPKSEDSGGLFSDHVPFVFRGMDIKVLSSILGHAQASTTLNLYAHALPDHKKSAWKRWVLSMENK